MNATIRDIHDHGDRKERAALPGFDGADSVTRFRVGMSTGKCAGQVVVALAGELDVVDADGVGALVATVAVRVPWLIVDLAGLEFIDCAGLRALAMVEQQARQAGGGLVLAAPTRLVRRVLDLTGMVTGVPVCATVEEAAGIVSARKLPGQDAQAAVVRSAAALPRQREDRQRDRLQQPETARAQLPHR